MKTLFTTLLILATLTCFSQRYGFTTEESAKNKPKTTPNEVDVTQSYADKHSELQFAGYYLIKSMNSKFLSWSCAAASAGVLYLNYQNEKPEDALTVLSGALVVASVFFEIRSVVLIGRAGQSMKVEKYNEKPKQLSFYANPQSAGVRLTF